MNKDESALQREAIRSVRMLQIEMALFLMGIVIGILTNFLADFIPYDWRNLRNPLGVAGFLISVSILVYAGFYIFGLLEKTHPQGEFKFEIPRKLWKNANILELGRFQGKIEEAKKNPTTDYCVYFVTLQVFECMKNALRRKKEESNDVDLCFTSVFGLTPPNVVRSPFTGRKIKLPPIAISVFAEYKYITLKYEIYPSYSHIFSPEWDEKILEYMSFCKRVIFDAYSSVRAFQDLEKATKWFEAYGEKIEYEKIEYKKQPISPFLSGVWIDRVEDDSDGANRSSDMPSSPET